MPIYGYRCASCGHEFEVLQKMSDLPLQTCPKCAGKLSKMMYAAGVIYKGSGYYSTDYKGGGKSSDKSAGKGSDTGSDKGSDNSASNGEPKSSDGAVESKPAAESKSESKASKSGSSTEKTS